jgi:hypothetical protein
MSTGTEENMSAALDRVLLTANYAAAIAGSVALRESAIVAIEAAAIAEPTADNVERARPARADLNDSISALADARADLETAEAAYATLAAAPREGNAQA